MSQYAKQILSRSKANLSGKSLSKNQKREVVMWAKEGMEVLNITKGLMTISPVDETEFWTEEDFEAHREECFMTREEYYG